MNTQDPWGRDPHEANDEDLSDLYDKNNSSNRPPSTNSVDRWGQHDDDEEQKPVTQPESRSQTPAGSKETKPSSRPSSRVVNEPVENGDTFTRNSKPASRTSTPIETNDKISDTPKSGSKPGTPDTSGFLQNRKPESKTATPVDDSGPEQVSKASTPDLIDSTNNRRPDDSKPGTPQSGRTSQNAKVASKPSTPDRTTPIGGTPNQSKPSSPITRSSRPQSLETKRPISVTEEPTNTSSPVRGMSRSSSQQNFRISPTPTKSPVSSRPPSKLDQSAKKPASGDSQLRSDSKRIRDDSLVLPKPLNNDEIRRKAFDNMKNKKAHPSYLFTKFPRVLEALMRYLPYRSLCKSQSVCRVWYKAGRYEKQRRNFIDSDCYKVELTRDDVPDDHDDDLQIDLYRVMDEMFVQPTTILAFMTWRTVTSLPDILFRILPVNCSSTCVSSDAGIIGTRKNGKIRIYADSVHESCSVLLMPKIDQFQVYQFSSQRPDQLKLNDRLMDSIGIKKYEDKKHVKCLLIFCSGGRVRNSNDITGPLLDKWDSEFQSAFQSRCLIAGTNVNFCQHGVKKILGNDAKLYSTENDVNGLAFQGENLEVLSFVLAKIEDDWLNNEFAEKVKLFVGQSPSNTYAIVLNGLNEEDEKSLLKKFRTVLPNTRIAGLRCNGNLFGQNFNSYDDRKSSKKQNIVLGQNLILIIFKISKGFSRGNNKNNPASTSSGGSGEKNILKGYKVK